MPCLKALMTRVLIPLEIDDSVPALNGHLHRLGGPTMGTTWSVLWVGAEGASTEPVRAAVMQELDLVVQEMSTWLPSSDLMRFNTAPVGTTCELPEAFAEVMQAALQLAQWTDGAFNPAAGALVNLWGFGPAPRYTDAGFVPPQDEAAQNALTRCDWRALTLQHHRMRQPGGLWLDLSAIAKGYAVDRVARRLLAMGCDHVLVEVGGELRGHGLRPGGQPWWVELEQPPQAPGQAHLTVTRVALHGLSVATSGDYRKVYMQGDQRQAHTLDPRIGRPIAHGLASVSVLHSDCMWADGWSTALTVLGLDAGWELALQHDLAAHFVQRERDGSLRERLTPAMEALLA